MSDSQDRKVEEFLRGLAPDDERERSALLASAQLRLFESFPGGFEEAAQSMFRKIQGTLHPVEEARTAKELDRETLAAEACRFEPSISTKLVERIEGFSERLLPHVARAFAKVLNVKITDLLVPNVVVQPTGMFGPAETVEETQANEKAKLQDPNDGTYLELKDFLGADDATTFAAEWSKLSESEFRTWLNRHAASQTSDYAKHLTLAVGFTCLLQDHHSAEIHAERCEELAEGKQRIDANYLFARNRWYLNRTEDQSLAFTALREALDLALEDFHFVRAAHCCIYMGRLGGKFTDLLSDRQTVDGLYNDALDYALRADRSDIELLSIHAKCVWLRNQKQNDKVREIAPQALNNPRYASYARLLNILRTALGMALRAIGTDESRREARETYDEAIRLASNDGMAAMCQYLKADIVADEMFSWKQAAIASSTPDRRRQLLQKADDRRREAIELCQRSARTLRQVGDLAALHKANLRLAFLENTLIREDADKRDGELVDDYAISFHRLKELILNAEYNEGPKQKSIAELQEIVELYFGSIVVNEMQRRGEKIDVNNILRETSLLCLSIPLANDLVQVVYSRDGDIVSTEGWFSIKDYANSVRPSLEDWLQMNEEDFCSYADVYWESIADKFRTVTPLKQSLVEKGIDDVVILSPVANTDWTVPIESLPMRIGLTDQTITLAKLCKRSAIYANSTRLIDVEATLGIGKCEVLASKQVIRGVAINDHAVNAGIDATPFSLSDSPIESDAEALVIFGHASQEFHDYLRQLEFPKAKVVVLLMCSGVESQMSRGPISENVTFEFSTKLAEDSVLVTSRIAISTAQACEFANFVLSDDNRNRSGAELVREAGIRADDPYKAPWVVLS